MVSTAHRVYIFWDNSNMYIAAQDIVGDHDGVFFRKALRLHFKNLFSLALAGRPLGSAYAVASDDKEDSAQWDRLRNDTGISLQIFERGGKSNSEQGVDQSLQLRMLRASHDEEQHQIAVLLTGDGAGHEEGVGFLADLERMNRRGWAVEVLSWAHSCNGQLRKWAESKGVFVSLDNYYDSVTFLEGSRVAKSINLKNRGRAKTPVALPNPQILLAELEKERHHLKIVEESLEKHEEKERNKLAYKKKPARRNTGSQK